MFTVQLDVNWCSDPFAPQWFRNHCTDRTSISPNTGREHTDNLGLNLKPLHSFSTNRERWKSFRLCCLCDGFFAQIFSLRANKGFSTEFNRVTSPMILNPLQRKKSIKINPKRCEKRSFTMLKIFWSIFTNFHFFQIFDDFGLTFDFSRSLQVEGYFASIKMEK